MKMAIECRPRATISHGSAVKPDPDFFSKNTKQWLQLLDVRDLSIRSVTVNGKVVDFRIAPNSYTFFGSKMTIYLPNDVQHDGSHLYAFAPFIVAEFSRDCFAIKHFTLSGALPYSTAPHLRQQLCSG